MNDAQKSLAKGALKSFVAGSTGVIIALNIVDAEHFNMISVGGWKHLLFAVLVAGIVAEARFLNQWAHSGNGANTTVVSLFLCALIACAGCAARVKNVTNLPPGVTLKQAQDWDAAVADLHKIAATTSTVRRTLIDLRGATYDGKPVLSDEYYADALRAIAHVDQLELAAEAVLRQSPQNFSSSTKLQVASYIQQILTEVEQLNATGATGIKNPQSLGKINGLLGTVAAAVKLVLAL